MCERAYTLRGNLLSSTIHAATHLQHNNQRCESSQLLNMSDPPSGGLGGTGGEGGRAGGAGGDGAGPQVNVVNTPSQTFLKRYEYVFKG
jgi:hypothetical protein